MLFRSAAPARRTRALSTLRAPGREHHGVPACASPAAQTRRLSLRLLRNRGRGRVLRSHPSPNSRPHPAPGARPSGARRSTARRIDALGAPAAEVRALAAGRPRPGSPWSSAGPCPCGPAGRCGGGEALAEAGRGRGLKGRRPPSAPRRPAAATVRRGPCAGPGAPPPPRRLGPCGGLEAPPRLPACAFGAPSLGGGWPLASAAPWRACLPVPA